MKAFVTPLAYPHKWELQREIVRPLTKTSGHVSLSWKNNPAVALPLPPPPPPIPKKFDFAVVAYGVATENSVKTVSFPTRLRTFARKVSNIDFFCKFYH